MPYRSAPPDGRQREGGDRFQSRIVDTPGPIGDPIPGHAMGMPGLPGLGSGSGPSFLPVIGHGRRFNENTPRPTGSPSRPNRCARSCRARRPARPPNQNPARPEALGGWFSESVADVKGCGAPLVNSRHEKSLARPGDEVHRHSRSKTPPWQRVSLDVLGRSSTIAKSAGDPREIGLRRERPIGLHG